MAEEFKTTTQRHVLVVDDNVELAETYRDLLEAFDYGVTTAANGEVALKFLLENDVDAVLSDLSMPLRDGPALYEAVQQARPEVSRRFIFMTGHVDNPKYETFLKGENVRTLYKPVMINSLLEALNAVFAETAGK
jgi:DNA-binding NtrC family response regulator